MIRAAHRTFSSDPGKPSDAKVNGELTRSPAVPASRWRSSLRSTPKERNGNAPKQSFRGCTGKENLANMNRSHQNGTKPAKTGVADKKEGRKTDKKDEIADKAKRKFMENLSKFQRESKQAEAAKNSPFQRSYRKGNGTVENASSAYRASYRPPPVARPDNLMTGVRRSLRKDRTSETTDKTYTKNAKSKISAASGDRSPKERSSARNEESDRSSVASSARATAGSLSSRPSSASSTATSTSDSSSRAPPTVQRKLSRAELAMERHMERMRKASSPSAGGNTFGTPTTNTNSIPPRPKPRQTAEADPLDGISATKLTFGKDNLYSPPQPPQKSSAGTVKDASLTKIEEGLKSLDFGEEWLDSLKFDGLGAQQTTPQPRRQIEPSISTSKSADSPKPSLSSLKSPSLSEWSSVQIIEDYVFEPPTPKSAGRATAADRQEALDESPHQKRPVNRAPEPIATRRQSSSRSVERASRDDDDAEINCSVEEAIDTFRKLSEEIDTLKSLDFGKKAKAQQKKARAKKSSAPEAEAKPPATRKESLTMPVSPPRVRVAELRTPSGVTAAREMAEAGSCAAGSASQTVATREERRALEQRAVTSPPAVARQTEGVSGASCASRHSNVAAVDEAAVLAKQSVVSVEAAPQPPERSAAAKVQSAVEEVAVKREEVVFEKHVIAQASSNIAKQAKANAEQQQEGKMSVKTQQRAGQRGKLAGMTAAEKRARLKRAVLKYQAEESSSDDESVFSDASTSGDEDGSWLDTTDTDASTSSFGKARQKKVASPARKTATPATQQRAQYNGDHKNPSRDAKTASRDSEGDGSVGADASRMKSMWESKMKESKVPVTSTPPADVTMERSQPSVSDAKSAFESPGHTVTSSPTRSENGDAEGGKKLGSMLSMWENKKGAKTAAYDASNDEAFNSSTMGRLQGAKALFQNMTKNSPSNEKPRPTPVSNEESPRPNTVSGAKNVFEGKSTLKTAAAAKPAASKQATSKPTTKAAAKRRKDSISDGSDFDDEDLSDVPTLSSTSSSEDELESSNDKVGSVRRMWENQSMKKKSGATKTGENQGAKQAWDKGGQQPQSEVAEEVIPETEEKMPITDKPPAVAKKPKSNIQRKISAKKKGDRRSMTQPITGDDVTAAKELVNEQRAQQASQIPDQGSGSPEEEKVPSFAERLAYFNQVCARNPPSPEKKPKRSSLKRYNTQPVDLESVLEARKKLEGQEAPDGADSAAPPSVQIEVPRDRVRKISESLQPKNGEAPPPDKPTRLSLASNSESSERSASGDEGEKQKVGKLKSKFLDKLPSPEPTRRRSPVRGKLPSIGSRSSGSIRDRSPSPLSSVRSASPHPSEDEPSSEDMGKVREAEIKSTGSIRDRMKLLQKNQEEDWKRKVRKDDQKAGIKSSLSDRMNKLQESEENWKKQGPTVNGGRSSAVGASNITDRLNSIMVNSEGWKSRSGKQNDASQFTVQSKIKRSHPNVVPILPSPSMKRRVLPVPTKADPVITIDDVSSEEPSLNKLNDVLKIARKGLEPEVIKTIEESTTQIPDLVDEDFESFFASSTITYEHREVLVTENGVANGSVDSDEEDPESMSWLVEEEHVEHLSQLGHLKRSVQRGSRNRSSTRNPLKALAARDDIKQSYTELRSNVTKLEQQRLASRHGHGSNFTSAALAGLAHRADFSKVSLRSTKTTSAFSASDYKPWKSKMLLRVKGRRRVQTRLVEPCAASLNSGDAFLLILPDKMYGWFGQFCNVIERAKVQEIADYIVHQGDMGSKASSINVIEENASSKIASREFWQHIGGKGDYDPSGGDEEDEMYEQNTEASIKTYKLVDSKLVPVQEAWGKLPTMGMLETTGTYVFDFGAEMYTWQGKEVSFNDRQLAVKLARALWDQGYDYTDVEFCPFAPIKQLSTALKGPRPEWGLFARVNENLETALIQEKFEDWSNIHREIGDREKLLKETSRGEVASEMVTKTNIRPEMTKCDVKEMIEQKTKPQPVVLEGFNLWRGYGEMYDEDGRGLEVVTSSVYCWKATDKTIEPIDENEIGVFYRGDTYVVRWRYAVSSTGKWSAEEGERNEGKKEPIGRERTAFFLWAGRDSTVNEKGASALMATEIDKEMGSQVIVTEGREPPAMAQCFKGAMVAVDGKHGQRSGFYSWKLFAVRGNSTDEASLHQVPCESQSLRSRTSFVALNARQAKVVVWHGCASPENTKNIAETAATKIQESKRLCLGFRASCKSVDLSVCKEGSESEDFTEAMLRIRRNKYASQLEEEASDVAFPRAWSLLPSGDQFVARELPPVARPLGDSVEPYPLVCEQLQDLTKPAFVLANTFDGVYLWMSSIPDDVKGSAKRQLDITKRLAMETAIDFCQEHRPGCDAMLIHENHEPIPFTNTFPYWKIADDKISIEQKRLKKPMAVKDILKTVTRLTYSLEELRATDNLPEGVDPNHLETYLSVKDFADLFEMDKEEFYKLPAWKQQNLRKEKNLF